MNKGFFLDISGVFAVVLCVIITIFFGRGSKGEYIFYMFSFLISGSLICFSLKDFPFRKEKIQDKFLSELVLLSEEDTVVKTWNILGKNSLVIGKKRI